MKADKDTHAYSAPAQNRKVKPKIEKKARTLIIKVRDFDLLSTVLFTALHESIKPFKELAEPGCVGEVLQHNLFVFVGPRDECLEQRTAVQLGHALGELVAMVKCKSFPCL